MILTTFKTSEIFGRISVLSCKRQVEASVYEQQGSEESSSLPILC